MAYTRYFYHFPTSNEYEYHFLGNYGAKGEKRAARQKPALEQIAKQNQRNRENYVRRLIKLNFKEGDFWITLKYPAGMRKPKEEVEKDMKRFRARMRKWYKKRGQPFKYLLRIEVGKRGGIHAHILINRIEGKPNTDQLVVKAWTEGRVNFETIYDAGGYRELAEYIVKPPWDDNEEKKNKPRYAPSRNLEKPEPEKKIYFRYTVRKIVEEGPEPTSGYYIDKDTLYIGVNPYTGMSSIRYTECKLGGGG